MSENYLRVALPPGIGDVHWVCTKLRALKALEGGRPIKAYVAQDFAHASTGYLDMVPFVDASEYSADAPRMLDDEMGGNHRDPRWSTLKGCRHYRGFDYWLVANGHLERGDRLESWLPELDTEFTYPLNIPQAARDKVADWGRVLLYPSGVGPNQGFHASWWRPTDWVEVVARLNAEGVRPVLVGAAQQDDGSYRDTLRYLLDRDQLLYEDRVGHTNLPEYCALIERASVWVGLNSGGGIVSAMRGTPTVMLWSNQNFPIQGVDYRNQLHPFMQTNWLTEGQLASYRTASYGSSDCTPARVAHLALEVAR
jgi:hypothetical protein